MMKMEEVSNLIELTEQFIEYLSDLRQEGIITNEQYATMTQKKLEFINQNRALVIR
ncbi:MAG: hypothetical protein ACLFMO_04355 [Eubacteriales bacterium]